MKPEELMEAPDPVEVASLAAEAGNWLSTSAQDVLRRLIFAYETRGAAYQTYVRLVQESDHEIEQILAKALLYPTLGERTVDGVKETCDPSAPGAIDTGVYCVGDHVPVTLAMEAAREIENLRNGP